MKRSRDTTAPPATSAAVTEFCQQLKALVRTTEAGVREVGSVGATASAVDAEAARALLDTIDEALSAATADLQAAQNVHGALEPSAQSLVDTCRALVDQQAAALEQLQQMARELGVNPHAAAPQPLRLSRRAALRESASSSLANTTTTTTEAPQPSSSSSSSLLSRPSFADVGLSEETQRALLAHAAPEKAPPHPPPPPAVQQQPQKAPLTAFESLAALSPVVPDYLLAQVTLDLLNRCTEALARAFAAQQQQELTTDEATAAIAEIGSTAAASAKTVLLILQKAGHIRTALRQTKLVWTIAAR